MGFNTTQRVKFITSARKIPRVSIDTWLFSVQKNGKPKEHSKLKTSKHKRPWPITRKQKKVSLFQKSALSLSFAWDALVEKGFKEFEGFKWKRERLYGRMFV